LASEAAAETARIQELALSADAPSSIESIPSRATDNFTDSQVFTKLTEASVVLRPMGNSRRMFLLDPHLSAEEMEGLAYRIGALSKNEAINSLLIATDDQVDNNPHSNCLPRYITQRKELNLDGVALDMDPAPHHTWYVAGGYDPMAVDPSDSEQIDYLVDSLSKLATAVQGRGTKVPVITMPHGAITDGGYALCMGSYMLATQETSFRILNPSRGLSLDPIGYSYMLPRLGWDFAQECKDYPGCGMILALAGYEADSFDLVMTGLATHLATDSGILPTLEEDLATLPPWNQQGLVKKRTQYYSQSFYPQNRPSRDMNADFRNKNVAYLIDQISDLAADSSHEFPFEYGAIYEGCDASLDTDAVPWDTGFYSSPLVDMAAALDDAFKKENSLEGLMERLKELGAKAENAALLNNDNADEVSVASVAKDLAERMERQSPLALRVVYQLMKLGRRRLTDMETCMKREANAQRSLLAGHDFTTWQAHVRKHGGNEANVPPFDGWQHSSVKEVTAEEVDIVIGDSSHTI
jgi:enoyl-CoA hydratase/carnithine racemase